MTRKRFSTAGFALLALTISSCSAPEESSEASNTTKESEAVADPYIWLEEVDGERALAWAEEQNARFLPTLEGDSRFDDLRAQTEAILTSDERIEYGSLDDGMVYNFWQDGEHVRGILRRTSLENYASGTPDWVTVLDIDALAEAEDDNWVYKGRSCHPDNPEICMISLSRGGGDAVVIREFDLAAGALVDGGFALPESKVRFTWFDADTLLIGADFGEGSMTASGYARTLRLWQRGTDIADAPTVFEVGAEDMTVTAFSTVHSNGRFVYASRRPDFFTEENYLVAADGTTQQLPLPITANFQGALGDQGIALMRGETSPEGVGTIPAGSLIAFDLEASAAEGTLQNLTIIFSPDERSAVDAAAGVRISSNSVYIPVLEDVVSKLVRARPVPSGGWIQEPIELPENGNVQLISADEHNDTLLANYESFLIPDSLYLIEGDAAPRVVASLNPRFDSSGWVSEQHFAASADGTQIPYFLVRREDDAMDGSTPTLLGAYGGFEVSLKPAYTSALQQGWLANGGAYVVANLRGGGEYGPRWHQAALLENRQRAFDDFIAVAEDLIASGLTSPAHLGIRGGSNGGLLTAVTMIQRPELFNGVISAVPLIDMFRYHKLLAGASWMAEYGDPEIPEHRSFIGAYSPYQNVRADGEYPKMLLWTNTRDDRVHPGHARKMAARMLEQGHDIMYFENIEGGHGGGANLLQSARTTALELVYLLQQLKDDPISQTD